MKKLFALIVGLLLSFDAALSRAGQLSNQAGNLGTLPNQGTITHTPIGGYSGARTPSLLDTYQEIFGNGIYHISQQKGSVLMPFVKMEGLVSTQKSINRMGVLDQPHEYVVRGSTVQPSNPEADVRWIQARRYWQACYVESWDEIRTLWDIKNAYTEALGMSFGRLFDRVVIEGALGPACVGPNTDQGRVVLPNSQKIAAYGPTPGATVDAGSAATAGQGLNVRTLRTVLRRMKRRHAVQAGETLIWAVTANEIDALLDDDKVINRDYTTIMTLMSGNVQAFLGFAFVQTELLPYNAEAVHYNISTGAIVGAPGAGIGTIPAGRGIRTFCFVQGRAICFGMNQNIFSRVSELERNHYNWQIYYSTEIGATRLEEVLVHEVLCLDQDPTTMA